MGDRNFLYFQATRRNTEKLKGFFNKTSMGGGNNKSSSSFSHSLSALLENYFSELFWASCAMKHVKISQSHTSSCYYEG